MNDALCFELVTISALLFIVFGFFRSLRLYEFCIRQLPLLLERYGARITLRSSYYVRVGFASLSLSGGIYIIWIELEHCLEDTLCVCGNSDFSSSSALAPALNNADDNVYGTALTFAFFLSAFFIFFLLSISCAFFVFFQYFAVHCSGFLFAR